MSSIDHIPPFKSILLPINPEQVQPQTVEFAARIAGQYEIALNLVFVFELPGRAKGDGFAVKSEAELEAGVIAIVEEVIKPLIGDVAIADTIIRSGRAADQIIAVADEL
ncbi:MAG: hypothetical protein JKY89_06840, partial [Immundisolibacteraceae bacterium]|nr:hypothetical protein [Immundisolibacteraceae bacterium]